MSDPRNAAPRIEIGAVHFDPESGDLRGPGGTGRLAPQPGRLLELLHARRGQVVSRPEMAAHLWPEGKMDADQGIAFAVREIRKGLESVGGDAAAVETIPRRGHRLSADTAPSLRASDSTPPVAPPSAGPKRPTSRRHLLLAAALAVTLVAWVMLSRGAASPVLIVYGHDGGDQATAHALAGRLGQQLTTALTSALEGEVGVIGPTGAATMDGPNDLATAAAVLSGCWVLSGAVETSEDTEQAVVFTQIVRTSDRVHVWASLDTLPVESAIEDVLPTVVAGVREATGSC